MFGFSKLETLRSVTDHFNFIKKIGYNNFSVFKYDKVIIVLIFNEKNCHSYDNKRSQENELAAIINYKLRNFINRNSENVYINIQSLEYMTPGNKEGFKENFKKSLTVKGFWYIDLQLLVIIPEE